MVRAQLVVPENLDHGINRDRHFCGRLELLALLHGLHLGLSHLRLYLGIRRQFHAAHVQQSFRLEVLRDKLSLDARCVADPALHVALRQLHADRTVLTLERLCRSRFVGVCGATAENVADAHRVVNGLHELRLLLIQRNNGCCDRGDVLSVKRPLKPTAGRERPPIFRRDKFVVSRLGQTLQFLDAGIVHAAAAQSLGQNRNAGGDFVQIVCLVFVFREPSRWNIIVVAPHGLNRLSHGIEFFQSVGIFIDAQELRVPLGHPKALFLGFVPDFPDFGPLEIVRNLTVFLASVRNPIERNAVRILELVFAQILARHAVTEGNPPYVIPALGRRVQEVLIVDEFFLYLLLGNDFHTRSRINTELRLVTDLDDAAAWKSQILHALAIGAIVLRAIGRARKQAFHHLGNGFSQLVCLLRIALADVWLCRASVERSFERFSV